MIGEHRPWSEIATGGIGIVKREDGLGNVFKRSSQSVVCVERQVIHAFPKLSTGSQCAFKDGGTIALYASWPYALEMTARHASSASMSV